MTTCTLPASLSLTPGNAIAALVIAALSALLVLWLPRWIMRQDRPGDSLRTRCLLIITHTVRLIVLTLGSLSALAVLHIPTASIITSLGLTGITLGFALRDLLTNLVAGMFLLLAEPFKIGDTISNSNPSFEGKITSIGLRVTHLTGPRGITVVPNSLLLTSPLTISC